MINGRWGHFAPFDHFPHLRNLSENEKTDRKYRQNETKR